MPATTPRRVQPPSGDDSFTEDYGETSQNQRTLGGGVDFFSSLGTDIKKKPRTDQPDPNKASSLYASMLVSDSDAANDPSQRA